MIDAATLAAGPLVATALGEFGAEVIKVEQPGAVTHCAHGAPRRDDVGLVWKSVSRNKKCVTPTSAPPTDARCCTGCSTVSDVLIVNTRPSTLARWQLDYDSVHDRHPKLVMLHVTGYGYGGPATDRPGFGTLAEAMSGFAHVTGQPDGPPTLPPFMLADGVAAMAATYAVMMALYHRDTHDAGGQLVDVSLVEPLARLVEQATLAYDQLGVVQSRTGNRVDASAPRNAYRTADDKWIALSSAASSTAIAVYRAIERPDLAALPDYVDPVPRQRRSRRSTARRRLGRQAFVRSGDEGVPRRRGGRRTGVRRRPVARRRAFARARHVRRGRRPQTRRDDRAGAGGGAERNTRRHQASRT